MTDNKNKGPKRFVGIFIILVILVLVYFLFYTGEKASPEIDKMEQGQTSEQQIKLPNVNDATPNIEKAPKLEQEAS
tara:strand:- start:81 stop:308 length:228 start_codon:yes stop_codon:yes gene_type:complete